MNQKNATARQMGTELGRALRAHRLAIALVAVFSTFVNLLGLTGSMFMLQVYDRVLPSRSEPTLVLLTVLVIVLFAAMGLLDLLRGQVGARIGAALQSAFDERVFRASLAPAPSMAKEAATALGDLEAVRRFLSAPVAFAFFDLPFAPVFIAIIWLFHPLLGWLAIGGSVVLVALMLLNQQASRSPGEIAGQTSSVSTRTAEQIRVQSDTVRSLGMVSAAIARWRKDRDAALRAEIALSDQNGGYGAWIKALRQFLQSAMLAVAAWLVISGEMTAGGMIAASILFGKALAPVELLVGSWPAVLRARRGWTSLNALLALDADRQPPTRLPPPKAQLKVLELTIVPPGETRPTLARVSFALGPGQAVGVIGESAAGKSSLARALVGLWRPAAGEIRLDGARIDQYEPEDYARYVGYLPQEVALFDGTVAENIARLQADAPAEEIIAAAKLAGAHQMILNLPQGYDTPAGPGGGKLSGGQKQRIALARALYGNPVVIVLDEPNSNLDAPGSEAINAAIRDLKSRGRIVIVMAHRPAALAECDCVLLLKNGQAAAFGPKDEVLRAAVANHAQITAGHKVAGGQA